MKSIKQKLSSRDGVTILIALVGFLVAAMVSIVIVTAATTAAQRVINDRKTNQAHLTLISAAQIVKNEMEDTTCTIVDNEDTGKSEYSAEGTFADEMKAAVTKTETGSEYSSTKEGTNFTITSPDGETDVEVFYVMKPDSNYEVTFNFTVKDTKEVVYLTVYGTKDRIGKNKTVISWINGKIGETQSQAQKTE